VAEVPKDTPEELKPEAHARAAGLFRSSAFAPEQADYRAHARRELRGRDLCCFCPLHLACHADVLLEIANNEEADLP
jgi:hypothetical protein